MKPFDPDMAPGSSKLLYMTGNISHSREPVVHADIYRPFFLGILVFFIKKIFFSFFLTCRTPPCNNILKAMRTIFTITICILCVVMILSISCNGRMPAVSFDGTRYKFGDVTEGKKIVFTFMFTNTGTKNLVIEELNVSCYCVVVKEYDKIVKPGGKGKIYGVVETEGFGGEVVKAIKVKTNVPDSEPVVLTLEGNILPRPE